MKGKTWKYGDNVDTDVIIPARYLTSSAPEVLKSHAMEDIDPDFAGKVQTGDFIVAGNNFGCGSSREHAPIALKSAGVAVVIAKSFARIFFRNAFNIGLPILECPAAVDNIEAGDELEVDLAAGTIKDLTRGKEFIALPTPDFMRRLIAEGGLLDSVKKRIAAGEIKPPAPKKPRPKPDEEVEPEPTPVKPRGARMAEIEKESEPAGVSAPWVEDAETEQPPPRANGAEDEDEEEGGEGNQQ
jgi:3-isopropylmalate/(R)-2-methylmalate dehydratase small subunit